MLSLQFISITFQKVKAGTAAAAHPRPAPGERSPNTQPFTAHKTLLVPGVPQLHSLPQHHPPSPGLAAQKDASLKSSEGKALPSLTTAAEMQSILPAGQCFC